MYSLQKLPKVNRLLAEKMLSDKTTPTNTDVANPTGDERFSSLFSNPDFEADVESEEFQLLHPLMAHREKVKNKKKAIEKEEHGEMVLYIAIDVRPMRLLRCFRS